MAEPDANFQLAVDRVAQHLSSEDSKAVAASTVTLTLMLQSTPLPVNLSAVVQRAAELLEASDAALQVTEGKSEPFSTSAASYLLSPSSSSRL